MFEVRKAAVTHTIIAKNSHFLAPILESAQRDGFMRRRFTKHFLADVLREADLEILYFRPSGRPGGRCEKTYNKFVIVLSLDVFKTYKENPIN